MMKTILKTMLMSILGGSLLISTQVFAESDATVVAKACREKAQSVGMTGKEYGQFMRGCAAGTGSGAAKGGKPVDDSDPVYVGL